MFKDYNCEILYHPGKDNVVVHALSHKETNAYVRDVCLWRTVVTPLLELIKGAQAKALK